MYLHTLGIWQKKCSPWAIGDVLNMDDRQTLGPKFCYELLGIFSSLLYIDQLHTATGKIVVLPDQ